MRRLLMGQLLMAMAGLFLAAQGALAQAQDTLAASDSRVKGELDHLGLKYEVSSKGNFRLIYDLDEDRSQLVIVHSATDDYEGFEIREVTSTAYRSDGPLSAELANKLLTANDLKKLGAWTAYPEDGSVYVDYSIQLPANADAKYLQVVIEYVMDEADELEKELTGKDEF